MNLCNLDIEQRLTEIETLDLLEIESSTVLKLSPVVKRWRVRGDSFGTCGMCPPRQLSSERAARDRYRFTRGAVFVRSKSRYEDHIGHLDAVFLFSAVFNKT